MWLWSYYTLDIRLVPVLKTIFHQCVISYTCSQSNSDGSVLKQCIHWSQRNSPNPWLTCTTGYLVYTCSSGRFTRSPACICGAEVCLPISRGCHSISQDEWGGNSIRGKKAEYWRVEKTGECPDWWTKISKTLFKDWGARCAYLEIEGLRVRALPEALVLCSWERHFILCLVLVQSRKTHPNITEKLLTGRLRIKSNKQNYSKPLKPLQMTISITLTLCILIYFPIHINTISMGLPIVFFKGSQVEFFKLWCISVSEGRLAPVSNVIFCSKTDNLSKIAAIHKLLE